MAVFVRTTCVAFTLLFSSAALAHAQSSLEWLAIHDGPASQADRAAKCAVDASGNVYVCGRSYNTALPQAQPTSDFETVKYSPSGVELWTRRLDNLGRDDSAADIAVDAAGDVYVTGTSTSGTNRRLALLKYQADGTLLWSQFLSPESASGYRLAFDAANNAIVLGTLNPETSISDVLVVSYSPLGQLLWSTHVDGGGHASDLGLALAITQSGDIYVAGGLIPHIISDFGLIKLNASGALQWVRTFDGGFGDWDTATAVAVYGNDRIAVTGIFAAGPTSFIGVVEYDAAGNGLGVRTYFDPLFGTNSAYFAAIDAGGVLWVLGATSSLVTGFSDFIMLRYDAAGLLLSTTRYDGPAHRSDVPYDLVLGTAGGALACGYSYGASGQWFDQDVVLVQYDADGRQISANTFSTAGTFQDVAFDADLAPNGRIAVAGWTTGGASGGFDYLALQFDSSDLPQGYCTAKVNSLGCTPITAFTGLSSASAAGGFVVRASNVRNHKNGLLFYGVSGAASLPFQGGTLCVQTPIRRTPAVNSNGAPAPANDCSGMYTLDLNAFATGSLGGTPLPALLVAGTQVHCQWWGRDPGFAAPDNTMLSSAIRYRVLP
jgi:hypothetical protein